MVCPLSTCFILGIHQCLCCGGRPILVISCIWNVSLASADDIGSGGGCIPRIGIEAGGNSYEKRNFMAALLLQVSASCSSGKSGDVWN